MYLKKCKLKDKCLPLLKNVKTKALLKNDTHQMSTKTHSLMDLAHNTFLHVDMTGDLAFISSEICSLRLCKCAEHL
jgi:hypothetical protein